MGRLKNIRWRKFCKEYASSNGKAADSYIKAFWPDRKNLKQSDYDNASKSASRLLKNVDICRRIESLLDKTGHNDVNIDRHRLFNIQQFDNLGVKQRAIESYDKLKGRVQSDKPQMTILNYEQFLINVGAIKPPDGEAHRLSEGGVRCLPVLPPENQEQKKPAYSFSPKWRADNIGEDNGEVSGGGEAVEIDNPQGEAGGSND